MTEQQVQADVMLALGQLADVRIWRQNSGMAVPLAELKAAIKDSRSPVPRRYGVNGCGDLSGILTVLGIGIRLEVEVKAEKGRQAEDQRKFQEMIESRGGIYILARSAQDALEQLDAARARMMERLTW